MIVGHWSAFSFAYSGISDKRVYFERWARDRRLELSTAAKAIYMAVVFCVLCFVFPDERKFTAWLGEEFVTWCNKVTEA